MLQTEFTLGKFPPLLSFAIAFLFFSIHLTGQVLAPFSENVEVKVPFTFYSAKKGEIQTIKIVDPPGELHWQFLKTEEVADGMQYEQNGIRIRLPGPGSKYPVIIEQTDRATPGDFELTLSAGKEAGADTSMTIRIRIITKEVTPPDWIISGAIGWGKANTTWGGSAMIELMKGFPTGGKKQLNLLVGPYVNAILGSGNTPYTVSSWGGLVGIERGVPDHLNFRIFGKTGVGNPNLNGKSELTRNEWGMVAGAGGFIGYTHQMMDIGLHTEALIDVTGANQGEIFIFTGIEVGFRF